MVGIVRLVGNFKISSTNIIHLYQLNEPNQFVLQSLSATQGVTPNLHSVWDEYFHFLQYLLHASICLRHHVSKKIRELMLPPENEVAGYMYTILWRCLCILSECTLATSWSSSFSCTSFSLFWAWTNCSFSFKWANTWTVEVTFFWSLWMSSFLSSIFSFKSTLLMRSCSKSIIWSPSASCSWTNYM